MDVPPGGRSIGRRRIHSLLAGELPHLSHRYPSPTADVVHPTTGRTSSRLRFLKIVRGGVAAAGRAVHPMSDFGLPLSSLITQAAMAPAYYTQPATPPLSGRNPEGKRARRLTRRY